jgi:Na+-driven multidrug efflux pump
MSDGSTKKIKKRQKILLAILATLSVTLIPICWVFPVPFSDLIQSINLLKSLSKYAEFIWIGIPLLGVIVSMIGQLVAKSRFAITFVFLSILHLINIVFVLYNLIG